MKNAESKDFSYEFRLFLINLAIKESVILELKREFYSFIIERNINYIDIFKIFDKEMKGYLSHVNILDFFKSMSVEKIQNERLENINEITFLILNNYEESMSYMKFNSLIYPLNEINFIDNYHNNNTKMNEFAFEINLKVSRIMLNHYFTILYIRGFFIEFQKSLFSKFSFDQLKIFLLLYKIKIKPTSSDKEYLSINDTFYRLESNKKDENYNINEDLIRQINRNFQNIFFVQKISKIICDKIGDNALKCISSEDINCLKEFYEANMKNSDNVNLSQCNRFKIILSYEITYKKSLSMINSKFMILLSCILKAEIGYFRYSKLIMIEINNDINRIIEILNFNTENDYKDLIDSFSTLNISISMFESNLIIKRFSKNKNEILS